MLFFKKKRAANYWRKYSQAGFFILFILAPVFDVFRLDLYLGHFILFGQHWKLDLVALAANGGDVMSLSWRVLSRAILPALTLVAAFIWISWKWGRIYCGWLCPHFSVVETLNQISRRASSKLSFWDAKSLPELNPDGSKTSQNPFYWLVFIGLVVLFGLLWGVVLLTYLLPPQTIYPALLSAQLTRNQSLFIAIASSVFCLDFLWARHLFCRYGCALGLFQSLIWMANPGALVVSYQRHQGQVCQNCFDACEHACPMRLPPRSVKRQMFACVQCTNCVQACQQVQGDAAVLDWVSGEPAKAEAQLHGKQARIIQIKRSD